MLDKLGNLLQPKNKKPYHLFQIEPSLECNLECVMCPWRELRPEEARMSRDTFNRIAAYFPLARAVDYTGGGEPTTNPLLPDMVRAAKEAGLEVGFSTNATLLDRDLAETLVSLEQDWISFSVDGATPETYESIRQGAQFQTVVENIQNLHQIKTNRGKKTPKMMMVFVMMRQNYHELPLYVELAQELGVEQIIFKNLDVILHGEDDERRLFSHNGPPASDLKPVMDQAGRRAKQLGVGLRWYHLQPREQPICEHNPLRNLFFNWAGYVSPCITLSYADTRYFAGKQHFVPCLRFGNINDGDPLETLWDRPDYREFRRPFEARVRQARQAAFDMLAGGSNSSAESVPDAPEVCRTCYYLYGI